MNSDWKKCYLFVGGNSSLNTVYQWKTKSPYSKVSVIDQASSSSYQTLGYQPVGSERQLGNMTNSSIPYHR